MSRLAYINIWQENYEIVNSTAELSCITKPYINLAIWDRQDDINIKPIVDWLAHKPFELEYKTSVGKVSKTLHKNLEVPIELNKSLKALTADIQKLAEVFSEYSLTNNIRLVIESVHDIPCPKFHQDNVTIRLICTYTGAGTEWLENSNVNTHADCCGGSVFRDSKKIQRLKPFQVAFMKGGLWADNSIGIYHRSPKPEIGQPRLVVKMDVA